MTVSEAFFLSEFRLFWVREMLFWVCGGVWGTILGEWRWVGYYFGWVEVSGALFWVSRGGSGIILGGWGWVGVSGALCWVGRGGWG